MPFLASTLVQQIGSGHPSVFVATTSQPLFFPHNLYPLRFSAEQISLIKFFLEEREMGEPNLHYCCDSIAAPPVMIHLCHAKWQFLGVHLMRTSSHMLMDYLRTLLNKKTFKHHWDHQKFPNDHNWEGGLKGRGGRQTKAHCQRWQGGWLQSVCCRVRDLAPWGRGAGEPPAPRDAFSLILKGGSSGQGFVSLWAARWMLLYLCYFIFVYLESVFKKHPSFSW